MKTKLDRAKTDKAELFLYYWNLLGDSGHIPAEEYNFDKDIGRKHRFDFAWPDSMIAVEVDGNAWHTKGGGRHGTDEDFEKTNLAVAMGWRVFHVSPTMLKNNPERWISMIKDFISA
jgi:very-short-patch-repair endonuclease